MGLTVGAACSPTGDEAASRASGGADTVRMTLSWVATESDGEPFGAIWSVAMDGAGQVYAADYQATRLWVLDADGHPLPAVGRKGEGPGEFEAPTGMGVDPMGRLVVRDIYRVTRFVGDDRTGTLAQFDTSFVGPTYAHWTSRRASRFTHEGDLFYPAERGMVGPAGPERITFVYRYTSGGVPVDSSLRVPVYANVPPGTAFVRLSASGGRMLAGLNHVPFAPLPVWDVTLEGTMISGDGIIYLLQETDRDGVVVRTFGRPEAPTAIDPREREDSLAALRARIDSIPVSIEQVQGMPDDVRQMLLPATYPAYMAVYATPSGAIWVRRWPAGGGDVTIFDRFTREGVYTDTVVLPRAIALEPTPVLTDTVVIGVVLDPDTDEEGVARFVVQ